MIDDYKKKISLDEIESAMLRRAKEIWNAVNVAEESFDPLVRLLIGACAQELKKISDEMYESEERILYRLAEIMLPDVCTLPTPASTIIQARPNEPTEVISPDCEFFANHQLGPKLQEYYFTPVDSHKLFDGKVEFCLAPRDGDFKDIGTDTLFEGNPQAPPPNAHTIWIGLDLNSGVAAWEGLTFYFDWLNVSRAEKESWLTHLHAATWRFCDESIETKAGIMRIDSRPTVDKELKQEILHANFNYEDLALAYNKHFIHLTTDFSKFKKAGERASGFRTRLPGPLAAVLDKEKFKKELLWFEVSFPNTTPESALNEYLTTCAINCFPAVNRKLKNDVYYLNPNMNIFPLRCEGYFLAINKIASAGSQAYEDATYLPNISHDHGTYFLRSGGVGRFDARNAAEALFQLLNLIREETLAFKAMGSDELTSDLTGIQQILLRLETRLVKQFENSDASWFVAVNPPKAQSGLPGNITISFWETLGERGNGLPPSPLTIMPSNEYSPAFHGREAKSLTASRGGRSKPDRTELIRLYKTAIQARERVVTVEDVKTYCRAKLGSELGKISVVKGVARGEGMRQGLTRTLEVRVAQKAKPAFTKNEWEYLCAELEAELNAKSNGIWPIRILHDRVREAQTA